MQIDMIEQQKREEISILLNEILSGGTSEERDKEIMTRIKELSPDPYWSDYIFCSFDYYDKDDNFLIEKFLDKIFSYKKNIIHL